MPQKDDCLRATRYICDLLENSGDYTIQRSDVHEAVVMENPRPGQEQRIISVVMANSYGSVPAYLKKVEDNAASGIYTAPVVYKDGESAFVLLTDKQRNKKSLRKYSPQERHQMIVLRKWEKLLAPANTVGIVSGEVTYYQPESERLDESLRRFRFGEVEFDYSYEMRSEYAEKFAEDGPSREIKFPHETGVITAAAAFIFESDLTVRLVEAEVKAEMKISSLSPRKVAKDLETMARNYFPGLDEETALAALSGEEL